MKKWLILLPVLLLLTGCAFRPGTADPTLPGAQVPETPVEVPTEAPTEAPTEPPAFAPGTTLWGLDLGGMDADRAAEALLPRINTYVLELTLNDRVLTLTDDDLGLILSREALERWCSGETDGSDVLTLDETVTRASISSQIDWPAQNARLEFREDRFVLIPEESGTAVNADEALAAIRQAVETGAHEAAATGEVYETQAAVTAGSEKARSTRDKANSLLGLKLRYTFTDKKGNTRKETMTRQQIAQCLYFDGELEMSFSQSGARDCAVDLGCLYYIPGRTGWFVTNDGRTIDAEVDYPAQVVDVDALGADILYCLENGISETRTAPYRQTTDRDTAYGGHYIEIDQMTQTIWLYKDGEVVLTSPVVTGNRRLHWYTPNGVFSLLRKDRNVLLGGEDFVYYWMPFYGANYGMHDATWRDEFGGDIYLKNGSHGCVNLPKSFAALLFDEIRVGTPVIIYREPELMEPSPTEEA